MIIGLSSRRDGMIVARHEGLGQRPSKEPSRRVRYDRAVGSTGIYRRNVRRVSLGRL